jgi:hypothetical protein
LINWERFDRDALHVVLSGPRLLRGLVRPGISLGNEDFRPARKAPAMVAEATLGLFRVNGAQIWKMLAARV